MSFFFSFSVSRRNYIEAKYVHKSFLRALPGSNPLRSSTRSIRRWSIVKQSLNSLNITNDTDDDASLPLKSNQRRLDFLNRSATSFDTDLNIGTTISRCAFEDLSLLRSLLQIILRQYGM